MEFDFDILKLSKKFVANYPPTKYPELMLKDDRPYNCLLIDTSLDYFICIPFRSSVLHNNAYIFKNTIRSKRTRSGLDYSKIVLIKDVSYLDSNHVVVDQDEYKNVATNIQQIVSEATDYINTYKKHINGSSPLHPKAFNRKYQYSTLSYFHDILGL